MSENLTGCLSGPAALFRPPPGLVIGMHTPERAPEITEIRRQATLVEGIAMLDTAAHRELTSLGLGQIDPISLTLDQLARIKTITESGDNSPSERAMAIKKVVADS